MSSEIAGLADTLARLAEAPQTLIEKIFPEALQAATAVVVEELRSRTPVGQEGLLGESVISVSQIDPAGLKGEAAIGFNSDQSERTGKPQDLIAKLVELGHEQEDHKRRKIGHVPAHPFMRPAVLGAAKQATEAFTEVIAENLFVLGQ